MCIQLITNAFLQASGFEKLALLSLPIGGIIKVVVNYFLVGSEKLNIVGAPIGTLVCYVSITAFNIYFIKKSMKNPPRFLLTLIKPVICTTVMAVAAIFSYNLLGNVLGLSASRFGMIAAMALAIIIAVAAYGASILLTGTITREDMQFVPKGEKIAKILRLK